MANSCNFWSYESQLVMGPDIPITTAIPWTECQSLEQQSILYLNMLLKVNLTWFLIDMTLFFVIGVFLRSKEQCHKWSMLLIFKCVKCQAMMHSISRVYIAKYNSLHVIDTMRQSL